MEEDKKFREHKCKWCGKILGSKESKSHHQKTCSKAESSNPSNICEKCGYCTVRKDTFKRRKETCKGEKEGFVCQICKKECKRKEHLQKHLLSHEKISHKCGTCGQTFKRIDFYSKHIQKACPNPKDNAAFADGYINDKDPFTFDEAFYGASRASYSMSWHEENEAATIEVSVLPESPVQFAIEAVAANEEVMYSNHRRI